MATTVVEVAPSREKTTFCDSSEEDITYAKTFWQSVQLLPPMESTLVSSDIKQRLKIAPPGNQPVVHTYPERGEPQKLVEFLNRAQDLQRAEEAARMERLAQKREEDLLLLHKHRATRVEKETISNGHGVVPPKPQPAPIPDFELDENFDENPEDALNAIHDFEKARDIIQDSDSDQDC